ncbi:MAG TPA: hypothetical protein VF914_03310 [Chloroflexia bacterium]
MMRPGLLYGSRIRAILSALFLLLFVLSPAHALAQRGNNNVLRTKYFNIFYPTAEEKSAAWYAGFADEVNEAVADLLGSQPVSGMKLLIFNTEAEYARANPMAELHPGIMAHAIPEQREIGVAVERLRQVPPELARESFRHEVTHIIAGYLTNQNLPVGFQEGLAQYNELSTSRGQEVASVMRQVKARGDPWLTWDELNDGETFRRVVDVGYPQSYSVMHFLADTYGMSTFARMMNNLRDGADLGDSIAWAYSKTTQQLEEEWRAWLPSFLDTGWRTNLLMAYDLAPAQALYDAGRFKEAEEQFTLSERLYRDLGKLEKADEIAAMRDKSKQAYTAGDLVGQADESLRSHDYAQAFNYATQAGSTYDNLDLDSSQTKAADTAQLAKRGVDALAQLEEAKKHLAGWNLPAAELSARSAADAFVELGDSERVAEVNGILASTWQYRRLAGFGALGLGVLALTLGAFAVVRAQKRNRVTQPRPYVEENRSWL